jgi:hypothetical protein
LGREKKNDAEIQARKEKGKKKNKNKRNREKVLFYVATFTI